MQSRTTATAPRSTPSQGAALFFSSPDSPVSSASKLQKLAEMESLPEAIEMSQVNWRGQEEAAE